eukprot:1505800-Pleurochrysis_carterae.AAC.1
MRMRPMRVVAALVELVICADVAASNDRVVRSGLLQEPQRRCKDDVGLVPLPAGGFGDGSRPLADLDPAPAPAGARRASEEIAQYA